MTVYTPLWLGPKPGDLEGPEYAAREDRQILAALFTEGVGNVQVGQLAVTQRAAGANMTVEVAPGTCYITGDDVARQGMYRTDVTAVESVPIAAAPASGSRIDLIVARVYDAQEIGGTKHGLVVEPVLGTAAASPVAPVAPNTSIPLAQVLVAAGVTSIQTAAITDRRAQAGANSLKVGTQAQPLTQAQRDGLSGVELYAGRLIYNSTAGRAEVYTGAAWVGIGSCQIDVYTASATWTKPTGAKLVMAICIGAGQGGAYNYGGGAGGGRSLTMLVAAQLPSTVAVTVPAGGPASTNANQAVSAGDATFGSYAGATGAKQGRIGGMPVGGVSAASGYLAEGQGGSNNSSPYGGGGGGLYGVEGFASGALPGGSVTQPGNSRSGTGLAGSGGGGGLDTTPAGAGGIPGGGGGSHNGGTYASGAGARGEVIIVTIF